jgi:hypothetical protein
MYVLYPKHGNRKILLNTPTIRFIFAAASGI